MISMSSDAVAILGFISLFVLMLLRVPVGMAMGLVGVSGFAFIVGGAAALKNVGHTTMRTVIHDYYRRTGKGTGSFAGVMRRLRQVQERFPDILSATPLCVIDDPLGLWLQ